MKTLLRYPNPTVTISRLLLLAMLLVSFHIHAQTAQTKTGAQQASKAEANWVVGLITHQGYDHRLPTERMREVEKTPKTAQSVRLLTHRHDDRQAEQAGRAAWALSEQPETTAQPSDGPAVSEADRILLQNASTPAWSDQPSPAATLAANDLIRY